MKFANRIICVAVACAMVLTSCVKSSEMEFHEVERIALQAWIEQHRPDLLENYQEDGGYYVELLDRGVADSLPVSDDNAWLWFDVTCRDLSGNVCLTRDADQARMQNAYTEYTHYVPFFLFCGADLFYSVLPRKRTQRRNTVDFKREVHRIKYEQKNKNSASQRSEEKGNLQKKEAVIEKLKALLDNEEETENDKQAAVKELMKEWNETGHVPFKDKDRLYKTYHDIVDKLFKALNMSASRRKLDNFKNSLKNDAKEGGQGLPRERERLMRAYEIKRNEIKTYENNLGFLTCSSKKGSSLLNEMNKKMEKLKEELQLLKEKIAAIDKEMADQQA